jgi:hypothetical protein
LRLIRWLFRVFGLGLLAAAFAAAIIDGARSIGAGRILLTPAGATAFWAAPNRLPLLAPFLEKHGAGFVWDPVIVDILMVPTWAVLAVPGVALLLASRRRARPIGYSSRER